MKSNALIFLLLLFPVLTACDQLGIETPAQETQRMVAEGKAIGSSCRQAGRALEDCYQINARASKAAIFDGWREMDAYMRENKLEDVTPKFPMSPPQSKLKKTPALEEPPAVNPADGQKPAETAPAASPTPAAPQKHTAAEAAAPEGRRTI